MPMSDSGTRKSPMTCGSTSPVLAFDRPWRTSFRSTPGSLRGLRRGGSALRRKPCRSADGDRPQTETGRRAANLVRHADIAELVHLVLRQLLQVVKLADVDTLFDQQVAMHGDERSLLLHRSGTPLQAAGIRADQDGRLLLVEPLRRRQVDSGRVVLAELLVVAAVRSPVTHRSRSDQDGVSGPELRLLLLQRRLQVVVS